MTVPDPVAARDQARAAFERHAWEEAYAAFEVADAAGLLDGADLEAFGQAAFFSGRAEHEHAIEEHAFRAYHDAGDTTRAAFMAFGLARGYGHVGKGAIALAWMRRGGKLIAGLPETYVDGYRALVESEAATAAGDIDRALALAQEAVDIGSRMTHPDLQASALANLGTLKIATGATNEGVALMEEASISAVNGELSPVTAGITCCQMIAACRDLTDYRRASEWTEATDQMCERTAVGGFPGVCRVHRAEVTALTGGWDRAEQELELAAGELLRFQAIPPLADGLYALGDLKRLKGDFAGAEATLREAHGFGRTPQPALALIRLAEGKTKAASSAIAAALEEQTWDQWARARLLPARAEIAVAAGEVAVARAAVEELTRIVETYHSPALEAGRRMTLGRVLLAEGDADGAARELRMAIRDWREVPSPFELARGRALLAQALVALDDEDAAELELTAAREEFERLGAKVDGAAASRTLQAIADRRSAPVAIHRTFMFTDIVGSTVLAESLGDAAWERVLAWHDEVVRGLVAAYSGEIVNSTGDGFFVAFDSARTGIECATAVQAAIARRQRDSGSTLTVRIGLHTAEANRRGSDYSGVGVNIAARVAALAGAGQVVVTSETLAEAGAVEAGEIRSVTVKGVSAPVSVAIVGG